MSGLLAPFEPRQGRPFDRAAVAHLLRRTTLGHEPALVERCLAAGPQRAVAFLVAGEAPDAREKSLRATLTTVLRGESPRDLAGWWWALLLATKSPFRARMSLFWHDHFATSWRKVRSSYWMWQQLETFERLGRGRFGELCLAIAKGPAMLRWLDNESNRKGRANENFARELFELFTLGRDNYSEDDIKEAARAFTGWRIGQEAFLFDRGQHDAGELQVLGRPVRGGRGSGEEVVALATKSEACARFLARKLCACFVGPDCPPAGVAELAALFREKEGDIGACLGVLLGSELFFDPAHRETRVRGPVEWMCWCLRSLEAMAAPTALHRAASRMGQSLLDPPDVAGWDEEEAWVSSASWLHRANFAGRLGRAGGPFHLRPSLERIVPAGSAAEECGFLVERLFPGGLAESERAPLVAQARAERDLPRAERLAALLGACLVLPRAHRF